MARAWIARSCSRPSTRSDAPRSAAGTRLDIAVYGGSALMLASNFRFSTEDVDVSKLEQPWPDWLRQIVDRARGGNGWQPDWFNDGVAFHLSALADLGGDHLEFGTFPRDGARRD